MTIAPTYSQENEGKRKHRKRERPDNYEEGFKVKAANRWKVWLLAQNFLKKMRETQIHGEKNTWNLQRRFQGDHLPKLSRESERKHKQREREGKLVI